MNASLNIFTPRAAIDRALDNFDSTNTASCCKIPYRGFGISISMDSGYTAGDLTRSDIRIYDSRGADVTMLLLPEYEAYGEVPATAETLQEAFAACDDMSRPQ